MSFFAKKLTTRHFLTRRTKWVLAAGLLVVLVGTAFGARQAAQSDPLPDEAAADSAMPVATMTATPVDSYRADRSYTGHVVARRASRLSFERPGKVIKILVDEGDTVARGQLIAELDTRHLLAQRQRLQAERAQAAAQLDELRAGPRHQTIAAARAQVRNLEAQRDQIKRSYERYQKLRKQGVVTESEYEDAYYSARAIAAQLDAAQKQLDELEAGTRVERVTAQAAVVAQLDARLAELAVDIDHARLVAPFAGRLAERRVDEGTVVAAGTPIFEIVERSNLEAWIGLPATTASRLNVGSTHDIEVGGRQYAATLTSLSPQLDTATRTRKAIFAFNDAADKSLVPAEVARVSLSEEIGATGYWLPADALVRSTRGLWSALVVVRDAKNDDRETVEPRDVELLYSAGHEVFVRGTLAPGDQVVSTGVHRIAAGQQVRSQTAATSVATTR
ncbi:MAG: efflux RND transporter periplasmic adaptor subunit [Pirellulales bacterium]|nr:efflux RND transporter periplasmic adaptor subunit [Pirellulales bacterium]